MPKDRSENWSSEEESTLLNVIGQYVHIIEQKKIDKTCMKKKKEAWGKIHDAITATYGDKWKLGKLQDKWKRMKILAKKEVHVREYQKALKRTGGGPGFQAVKIQEMIPGDFEKPTNAYDDDNNLDDTQNVETYV